MYKQQANQTLMGLHLNNSHRVQQQVVTTVIVLE